MWPFTRKAKAAQATPLADATRGQHPTTVRGLLQLAGYSTDNIGVALGRSQCMAIPAFRNGIIIFSSICNRLPLTIQDVATGESQPDHRSEAWVSRPNPDRTRGYELVATMLDLIYNQVSFWRVLTYNAQGYPSSSEHIDLSRIQVIPPSHDNPMGAIQIDGHDQNLKDMIRFDGIVEGVLQSAQESLLMAYANIRAAKNYASKPLPAWLLVDADPNADPLPEEDQNNYLDALDAAVDARGSAYASGVDVRSLSWNAREIQLVEARQQDAVDMARVLGVPTRYVAAPSQGAELTYANLADVRRDLYENGGLATYLPVIEDRLSMPDCTPRGKQVRFDPDSFFGQVVDTPTTPDGGQTVPQLPAIGHRAIAHRAYALHDATVGEGLAKVTAANSGKRLIEGLIVPWDEVGYAMLDDQPCPQVYEPGSLIGWDADPPELPLTVNHGGPVAASCERVWTDDRGVWGRWKAENTPAGDRALAVALAAQDDSELPAGLSLEALIPPEAVFDPQSGILTVSAEHPGKLERVAMVDYPAFNRAGVSRAVANQAPATDPRQASAANVPDEALANALAGLQESIQKQTEVLTSLQQGQADEIAADPADQAAASRPNPTGATAATTVTREAFPYGHAGAEGSSFFRDLYKQGREPNTDAGRAAASRVEKAHKMWEELGQARAAAGASHTVNCGCGAVHHGMAARPGLATAANEPIPQANVFVPNNYDLGLYVGEIVFPRKLTDGAPKTVIDGPNPFLYPKLASGPVADGGSGEVVTAHSEGTNPAPGEADIDAITATPLPYSGTFDINREAVDGANPGMDEILFGFLQESYNRVTELAFWTALYATSGITSPTSVTTDADLEVEARAMAKQIRGEQAAFDVRRGVGPDRIFFGSGVWTSALGADSTATSGEALYPYYNPTNRDARSTNNQTVAVDVRGVIGESAAQATSAKVTQVRFADLHVWESSGSVFRWEEVAGPAKIRFSLFKYFVGKVIQPKGVTVHTQA